MTKWGGRSAFGKEMKRLDGVREEFAQMRILTDAARLMVLTNE